MGSLDKLPSMALEYDMRGALELMSSRIGSNVRALVVSDSVDLGACSNLSRVRLRIPDQ
jgi:hypothetical protein